MSASWLTTRSISGRRGNEALAKPRAYKRHGALLGVLLLALATPAGSPFAGATSPAPASLAGLPLCFEANLGQAGPEVQFIARARGGTFLLSPAQASVVLPAGTPISLDPLAQYGDRLRNRSLGTRTVSLQFVGANPAAAMTGEAMLPGKVNYFLGNDPANWRSDLPLFERVCAGDLYPGVELVYYGNQQKLEYDFVVAPGADVGAIRLRVTGADQLELDAQGDLVLNVGAAQLRQHKPIVHQLIGGTRRDVAAGYRLIDSQTVAFQVGSYDPQSPLTIDPILTYASYLGGTSTDTAWDIAVDATGDIYVAGETLSAGLPATPAAFQTNFANGLPGGGGDAFVAKFDNTGSNLVYLTYLGGSGDDAALALALDATNNVYLTGLTDSRNFPLNSPIRPAITGTPSPFFGLLPPDAFVTKLNPNGSALIYSTYVGGDNADEGIALAVDPAGNAYVTGFTGSSNFLTFNAIQTNLAGSADAFVVKLGPAGSNFIYSTYLGGTNWDQGNAIAADALGRAFVCGVTSSTNFPVTNATQPWLAGGYDAFVTVIGANGTNLVRSTYLGGSADDYVQRAKLNRDTDLYITGKDSSFVSDLGSFPILAGNLDPGGALVSTDAGVTWTPFTNGLLHPWIYSLALDPAAPGRIYAGTARGVARSTDGGQTWTTTTNAVPTTDRLAPAIAVGIVHALTVDPAVPSTLYAGTGVGVYKSLDAGTSWSLSSTGLVSAYPQSHVWTLAIDSANASTLYAGTDSGVYWSTNSAINWAARNRGMGGVSVRALLVDPLTPTTLYAATYGYGAYRSLDRGNTWTAFNNGLTNLYCQALAIDPLSPSTLYAGTTDGLFKSTNQGTNWTLLPLSLPYTNGLSVSALAVDPSAPTTVYAGTSAGVFRSTDAGLRWIPLNVGIPAGTILCLAMSPTSPTSLYAGGAFGAFFSGYFLAKLDAKTGTVLASIDVGGNGLAVDNEGNAYFIQSTTAVNLYSVQTFGSLTATNHGGNDVFASAVSADASALLYAVYLGGSRDDYGYNVAVDQTGNAFIAGQTSSTDFPTNSAFQSVLAGAADAFIAKIEPRPLLLVSRVGSNVKLQWPAFPPPLYALETTPSLLGASWTVVSQPPITPIVNGWYTVIRPADNPRAFFRLRRL